MYNLAFAYPMAALRHKPIVREPHPAQARPSAPQSLPSCNRAGWFGIKSTVEEAGQPSPDDLLGLAHDAVDQLLGHVISHKIAARPKSATCGSGRFAMEDNFNRFVAAFSLNLK